MTLVQSIENVLKHAIEARIDYLEHLYALPVVIYKVKTNVYSDVYGRAGGEELGNGYPTKLLVVSDSFTPVDLNSAGTLNEGWVYTNQELNVGDRIEIKRADNRVRNYKIESMASLGSSTQVFKKYRVSSLAD